MMMTTTTMMMMMTMTAAAVFRSIIKTGRSQSYSRSSKTDNKPRHAPIL
jgi:hypothetical protein